MEGESETLAEVQGRGGGTIVGEDLLRQAKARKLCLGLVKEMRRLQGDYSIGTRHFVGLQEINVRVDAMLRHSRTNKA